MVRGTHAEIHFLMLCPTHTDERVHLLQAANSVIPDFSTLSAPDQFVQLMSSRDRKILFYLGKFLHKCMPL